MSIPAICLCADEGLRDVCHDESSECYGKCSKCCGAFKKYTEALLSWANSGASKPTDKIHKTFWLHCKDHHGYKGFDKTTHAGNGAPQGAFAFTITKSPSDDLTEEDMIVAVRKVMNQKSCPVKRFAWYLEYGEKESKGHPHIHGMYETESGGVIERKHWKRAWKIWDPDQRLGAGFRGGYHRPVKVEESYKDYIKKDGGTCESFNLT